MQAPRHHAKMHIGRRPRGCRGESAGRASMRRTRMRTWCDWTFRGLGRIGMLALLSGLGLGASAAHAATLDPAALPQIEAATFEVVQAKPASDPLTYEKPLPLDL